MIEMFKAGELYKLQDGGQTLLFQCLAVVSEEPAHVTIFGAFVTKDLELGEPDEILIRKVDFQKWTLEEIT